MSGLRAVRYLKKWLEGDNDNIKIGWYSEKQRIMMWRLRHFNVLPQGVTCGNRKHSCANIYLTPEGREIMVTEVSDGLVYRSNWDDAIMVGPVIKWKRSIYSLNTISKKTNEFYCYPTTNYKNYNNNKGVEDIKESLTLSFENTDKSNIKDNIDLYKDDTIYYDKKAFG